MSKGVTYGPFKPDAEGLTLPTPRQTRRDFEQMLELGANCVRIYHTPPIWFLDLAQEMGLKIFLDVAWAKNLTFVGDAELTRQAHEGGAVGRAGVRESSGDVCPQRRQRDSIGHRAIRRRARRSRNSSTNWWSSPRRKRRIAW